MRRFVPYLVALGLVAAVVVPYLALGGGSFEPTPVADACDLASKPTAEGLGETIERIALTAVDKVACQLGVSREELVLALRSEEAFDAFAREERHRQSGGGTAIHDGLYGGSRPGRAGRHAPRLDRAARAQGGRVGVAVAHPRDARASRKPSG